MTQPEADLFQTLVHEAYVPHRNNLIALNRTLQLQAYQDSYHNKSTRGAAIEFQKEVEALIERGFELGFFTLNEV